METAAISYRVAEFLKRYPPFNAIDETDLLALAARGRVRFHEPNDYVLWQGEPHRHQVYVIQQGTVSLWDDEGHHELRDVRGAGDMLGLERYNGAARCRYSARSDSDVIIYAFPSEDFGQYVLKYDHAAEYVEADARVTPDYRASRGSHEPHRMLLRSLVPDHQPLICRATDTVAAAATRMLDAGAQAIAVIAADGRLSGVLTDRVLLAWLAAGAGDARQQTLETLAHDTTLVLPGDASVADGIVAMSHGSEDAAVITADGSAAGEIERVLPRYDFARAFAEQPLDLVRSIGQARTIDELHLLNQRVRGMVLGCLTGTTSVPWLAKLTNIADAALVSRLLTLDGQPVPGCWCFCGSSGRGESLTRLAPYLMVIVDDDEDLELAQRQYEHVSAALGASGYLPRNLDLEPSFHVASVSDWKRRFRAWVTDPIRQEMHRARSLFDLQPIHGRRILWSDVTESVTGVIDRGFLHVIANDCLASLPPLTFYEDAVVDTAGERLSTFQILESTVRPLVDVGRVFGLAAGKVFGCSTLERFATARTMLPQHEQIFREAADTFQVVLWLQGRIGISEGTSGAELPPTLLSRTDRHVLKSGFRSILQLLRFTADREWLTRP